jgi:tetratricopeptide (TPR) repeat protein
MEDKTESAIEIFKLLVSEFPNSANPCDSLGEAFRKAGNETLAIANYEKSIELNPKNNHAIDQVTILKGLELLVTDWRKKSSFQKAGLSQIARTFGLMFLCGRLRISKPLQQKNWTTT